jgi:hypothetical protein
MEQKISPWKANLTNGIILGLISVVITLILYFLDMTTNKTVGYLMIPLNIVILYFMIKSYRDTYCHGILSYGQSVGAGVIILLYSTVISVLFTYILYKFVDPGLIAKSLAISEDEMVKRGMTQEQITAAMNFTRKLITPEFMLITGIFFGMFFGTLAALIVSIFTRKEGNPLLDSTENN